MVFWSLSLDFWTFTSFLSGAWKSNDSTLSVSDAAPPDEAEVEWPTPIFFSSALG